MSLPPEIAIHAAAAIGATVLGPFVLWTRLRREKHPRLHRGLGYAWVTLMAATALSGLFIRNFFHFNIGGYTAIHLLVPVVLGALVAAFVALARGNIPAHRYTLQSLYFGACIVAGAFTLLPGRYFGRMVFGAFAA